MSWRPGAKAAAFAALAILAVAALLPLAAADHAYSHRYVVYGRVVDANGDPVPGLAVDVGYEPPFSPEGACANQPGTETEAFGPTRTSPVTNQYGEFIFCFHVHSISRSLPGTGIVRIDSLQYEKRFEFDGYMRYSFVPVELATAHPEANTAIVEESYTVQGRAWRAEGTDIRVESVRVYGDTVQNQPVNITFEYNGKPAETFSTTTNGYGDFSLRIPVTERPTTGRVTVVIENNTFTEDVNPQLGTTAFRAEFDKPGGALSANVLYGLGAVALVAVGGGAAWYATKRVAAARETRVLRERSDRKRAKK